MILSHKNESVSAYGLIPLECAVGKHGRIFSFLLELESGVGDWRPVQSVVTPGAGRHDVGEESLRR